LFERHRLAIPKRLKVSCGFPCTGNRKKAIGECWVPVQEGDFTHVFVSPLLSDEIAPNGVLNTLSHELLHASLGRGVGHKKPFVTAMESLGMEGKAPASTAGPGLVEQFRTIVAEIGPYPHRGLTLPSFSGGEKKQSCRQLKVACSCGLMIRVTQKWLDRGRPKCWLCGAEMYIENSESGELSGEEG
jgi:hypothetical protein